MQKQELPKSEYCLNCGYSVIEHKYCPQCGQENVEYRVKLKVLLKYYLSKYIRLDTKLLKTIKVLILSPWKLSEAYLQGKRKEYTAPFRIYLMMSVLFFLGLRFQVMQNKPNNNSKNISINIDLLNTKKDHQVDSQKFVLQFIAQLPNAMLISVPLVAFILFLMYYHKKKYFFIDHFILMLHYYAIVYLISIPFWFINWLHNLIFIPFMVAIVYLWLTLKYFYKENVFLTALKYFIFSIFSTLIVGLVSALLVLLLLFKETVLIN